MTILEKYIGIMEKLHINNDVLQNTINIQTDEDKRPFTTYNNNEVTTSITVNKNNEFYLFCCDEQYDVVGDSLWDSIEMCMAVANTSHGGQIIWIKNEV